MKHFYKILCLLFLITLKAFAQIDGSVDTSFNTGLGFSGGFNSTTGIVTQPDEKIVVVGGYTNFNGLVQNRITRLNPNGTIDFNFNIGTGLNDYAETVALQADGKIVVGGNFSSYNEINSNKIVRINSNGTFDNTFNIGLGFNDMVKKIVIQPDGKIIAVGSFSEFNGVTKNQIVRLNTDGTIDTTFNIGTGFNNSVLGIAIQPNGKILIGGHFTSYNNIAVNKLVRLNADGTLDTSFQLAGSGFNNDVLAIALQSDGKILVGGTFTSFNSESQNRIIRFNSDGSKDNTFNIGTGFNNFIENITIESSGKILIGGSFTSYKGVPSSRIVRIHSDGTFDEAFYIDSGFNQNVYPVVLDANNNILIGGIFTSFNNQAHNRIIRLLNSCVVNIPDANFKNYLLNNPLINTNGDNEIQCNEAATFTGGIDINNKNISDLTGIEAFVNIIALFCSSNNLTSLDVSQNTALLYLYLTYNNLTSLDISQNNVLIDLDVRNNQLTSLNLKNGNISVLNTLFAQNNPNLSCIDVDNVSMATAKSFWQKPVTASYSTNCSAPPCIVNIPDANFKNYLLNNPLINTNGDNEIQCDEATAFTGAMNVDFRNITDLTGIEAFVNLTILSANHNQLTTLDISNNPNITYLFLFNNQLTNLDISNNLNLINLIVFNNQLTSLDISNNTELEYLYLSNNQLTSLDLSNNLALKELESDYNQLTSLDLSNNVEIEYLSIENNLLTFLNSKNGNNTNFSYFNAKNNPNLTCIQVDNANWSTLNWINIDASASFSQDCSGISNIVFNDASVVYDGNEHTITAENLPNGTTISYEITNADNQTSQGNSATNAGIYQIKATITSSFYGEEELTATLTINKAQAIVTANDIQTFVYDGTIKNVEASLNHNETTLEFTPQQGYSEVGTHIITISVNETQNYLAANEEVSLVIEATDYEGITFDDATFVYDGTAHSIFVVGAPENAIITYTNNGQINAETYTVSAEIQIPNYNNLVLSADLIITKAQAIITTNDVQTFVYDGTIKNVEATLNHNETTLEFTPQQGYSEAGTHIITISVNETQNYLAANEEVSLVIETADYEGITFDDATFVYDGTAHSIFVVGAPENAIITYTNNGQINAETYTVSAEIQIPNYNNLVLSADLIITKAQAIITANDVQTFVYDGTIKNVEATLNHNEAILEFTPQQGYSEVGVHLITVSANETQNYLATSEEVSLVIETADYEGITFDDATFVYDGTAHSIFVVGAPENAIITYTNNGQINAETYTVSVEIQIPNYNVLVLSADLIITKAQAVIMANDIQTFVYDGTIKNVEATLNHSETTLEFTPQQGYSEVGTHIITISASETQNYLAANEEVSLVIEQNLSIVDITKSNIKIYPNPVFKGNSVQINIPNELLFDMNIQLFDLTGRLIKEIRSDREITEFEIPSNLPSGTYLLKLKNDKLVETRKLIVK